MRLRTCCLFKVCDEALEDNEDFSWSWLETPSSVLESLSSMCLRLDFSASNSALEIMKAILFLFVWEVVSLLGFSKPVVFSQTRDADVRMMGGELPMKEAEMAIAALDSDGDGLLSLEDFIALMEAGGKEQKLNDLKVAFDMYDTESCGFITPKSLKKMLKKMGESKSIDECKSMIK
ncbi:Calcium-binding protein CML37 [Glycine soja]|nr:Calcium-binding protein CML37 [Glycine soja]